MMQTMIGNWLKGNSQFYFVICVMKAKIIWHSFVKKIVSPLFLEWILSSQNLYLPFMADIPIFIY